MTDDRDLRSSRGAEGGPQEDDDPTLETQDKDDTQETTLETQLSRSAKWGSRLEQMTYARQARKRLIRNRLWLTATPVLLMIVVAVVLLSVYGGQGGGGTEVDTTNVVARVAADGSAMLLIEEEGSLSYAVLLQPWGDGGVVLAVPAITLLETRGAFSTLAQVYQEDGSDAVERALSGAFDIPVGYVAVVDMPGLQAALAAAGIAPILANGASSVQGDAEATAQATRDLVSDYSLDGGADAWNSMDLRGGEKAEFLEAVELDSASMAESVWTAGALGGRVVVGEGFVYMDPDIATARSLLVVTVENTVTSVEIRDGAGVEGAARSAGSLIAAAGFVLAPMSYAQDYPNVQTTQIWTSAGDREEAEQVAGILGLGEVVESEQAPPGQIIVILGRDFGVASTSTTASSE